MMMRRLTIAAVAIASAAVGLASGRAGGTAPSPVDRAAGCSRAQLSGGDATNRLAAGTGLWAVADGRLVSPGSSEAVPVSTGGSGEVIRHVAAQAGVGTAYIVDRPGGDVVVAVTPEGSRRIPQNVEASHPTWSPSGTLAWSVGAGIRVLRPGSSTVRSIRSPVEGGTAFSPVFLGEGRIAAIVSPPPTDRVPDGERVSNLWVARMNGNGWHRLTRFRARGDRWIALRTPLVRDGGVDVIRVAGRGSATVDPSFELWRIEGGAARRIRSLPEERYLAGELGGRLLWNVPEPSRGRHLIAIEVNGGLRAIGCGAVMVDPFDVVDPDSRAGGSLVPPRGPMPDADMATSGQAEIGIIVGDFSAVGEAREVAGVIGSAFPNEIVDVVDSSQAPLAIRPGVFGALLSLHPDADPTAALAEFRERLPQYAAMSWVVTP